MTARFILSRPRALALAVAFALGSAALPALAQDPPARAGRIAYLTGPVSLSPGGTDAWAQAPLNRPLVAGDRLWTDAGGRDEVQFGPVIARMDAGTLLTVLAADEGATQLQVSQGRIDLHVRRVDPNSVVEVDTPNLAFVVRAPGDYRIVVSPDGASTDVAVLRGGGDVYGDGNAYAIGPNQGYRFAGQDLQNLGNAPVQPYDDFDRWAFARDARLDRAQSARFVSADVVGYEDLDDNGAWRDVPDYGAVWVPTRVAADWAPYQSGHWAWVDPWGWTWVDDQPWGYAVSHYGRWVNLDNRWAWVPAPVRERPVFAPALVAFVGATLAFGGRGDGPGIGWFPLGPHEPYRPPYRASPTYITNINITNTQFVRGGLDGYLQHPDRIRYVNRGVRGALFAMPAAQFAGAAPVHRAGRALDPRFALGAPLTAGPGARPLPQSRLGAALSHRPPPDAVQRRLAVARSLPSGFGRPGGPAFAQGPGREAGSGGRPNFGPGPAVPVRMLRPAASVRQGVPPPHGAGGPRMAGGPGMDPGAAPGRSGPAPQQGLMGAPGHGPHGAPAGLAPASAPYPGRGLGVHGEGQRWAGALGGPGADGGARGFAHGGAQAAGRGPEPQAGGRIDAAPGAVVQAGPGHQQGMPMHGVAGAALPNAPHGPRDAHARPQMRPVQDERARFADAGHVQAAPRAEARPEVRRENPQPQQHHEAPRPQPQPQQHHDAPRPQPQPQQHHDAPRPQPQPQPQQHHEAPRPQPQPQPQPHHEAPRPQPQPQQHHEPPHPQPQPQPQQHHDAPRPQPKQHHDAPPQHQGGGGGGHDHGHGH